LSSQKAAEEEQLALKERLKGIQDKPVSRNSLAETLAAAADVWGGGGGTFSSLYNKMNPNMSEAQKAEAIAKLEDTIRKNRGDITASQVALLKAQFGLESGLAKQAGKDAKVPDVKEWQYKAGEFASRAGSGDAELDALFAGGYMPNPGGSLLPEFLKPEKRKQYDGAIQSFVNSVLRRESGASISDPEALKAIRQYIPVEGDTPRIVAEKSARRKQAIGNMAVTAGPAMQLMQAAAPVASVSESPLPSLAPEKLARLQELRAKQAAGTIKK
jgi:uncharacterized protein YukE